MNSSIRIPLSLQSGSAGMSGGVSHSQGPLSGRRGAGNQNSSGRWTSPRMNTATEPPSKVTTLDHIISQSNSQSKESFCGQNARSSLDGGIATSNFMSKTFSGSRSLLDSRHQQQQQQPTSSTPGHDKSKSQHGQFDHLKQMPKARRTDKMTRHSTSSITNSSGSNLHSSGHPEQSDANSQGSLEEYPEALRQEISELQQALIDKFRGSNKMVSGAQFRNSLAPGAHKCDACEGKDNSLKKAKETIRSLRFQLQQTEEKLFSKNGGAGSGQQLPRGMTEDVAQLRAKNEELAARVSGLEFSNSELKQRVEVEKMLQQQNRRDSFRAEVDSENDAARRRLEHEETEKQCRALRDAAVENDKMMLQLKDQLNLKCAYAKDLEDKLSMAKAASPQKRLQMNDMEARMNEAAASAKSLRKELDVSRAQQKDQKMENEMSELELQRLSQLQKDQLQELDEAKATIIQLQETIKESDVIISTTREEALNAQDTIRKLEGEIQDLKGQLANAEVRMDDLQSDLVAVRSDADEANSKMNTMVRRMTADSENSAKAIQKAISSSVRLCVVAPTVNVHVADKKMKFRTNIPKDELEKFLQEQVLSKYTFLFEQTKENGAPDGVTDLQPWIKKVLAEMQESVENHISSAMKNGH